MRIGNVSGRLSLLTAGGSIDVHTASSGRFGPDPQSVFDVWCDFTSWAGAVSGLTATSYDEGSLGPPTPAPRQVFAVGLNYTEHAREAGLGVPDADPLIFTKFVTCLAGPYCEVTLPRGGQTDWEVELVVVIGQRAERVAPASAWSYVAGLMVGQDLSERRSQLVGPSPQFSLAKSFPAFGPIGPALVTLDEFDDPDDLFITADLNGERVQEARTSQLIFDVPTLVNRISAVTPLLPGDIIFTGTPSGVGMGRTPQRWLGPGDQLVSRIEGLGALRQTFVSHESDPGARPCPP